jgi:hypothetical protein
MVKVHKMFCISQENANSLANMNASSLVDELLTNYFNNQDPHNLSIEELQKKIKLLELENEMEVVKNGK